jgi:hypothetical protein
MNRKWDGWFKDGSAACLSSEAETCSHCLEELEPAVLCVQYCCKYGFHENCAMSWLLHEGTGDMPNQRYRTNSFQMPVLQSCAT